MQRRVRRTQAVVLGCGPHAPITQAQRASVPRLHHGHRHNGAGTTSLPESRFAISQSRKGRSSTLPLPPNYYSTAHYSLFTQISENRLHSLFFPLREKLVLLGGKDQSPLFFSSQFIGSQSSTLFPSGSMIQANFPFSCDSGPLTISTPPACSCAIISSRSSTR